MIFIKYLEKITDTKYSTSLIHYQPFDKVNGLGKTQEELEKEGILVDSILQPTVQEGKSPVMYVNPTTKEIFYEYVDIPKTQEQLLQDRIDLIQKAIDDLVLGGAL